MPPEDTNGLPFLTRKMLSFEHATTFSLRVTTHATQAVAVSIKGFTREGLFSLTHTTTGDGSNTTKDFALPDFPTWVSVFDEGGNFKQGECYITLDLYANGDKLYQYLAGFIYSLKALSWPGGNSLDMWPNGGIIKMITGTDPAANTEINETIPNGRQWRVISVQFDLTTDANVADRRVRLGFDDGSDNFLRIAATAVQTASTTIKYIYGVNMPFNNDATANLQTAPLPDGLLLPETWDITTQTTNRQVGDNYTSPLIYVEELFVRP